MPEALRGSYSYAFGVGLPAARVYHKMYRASRSMSFMGISYCGKLAYRVRLDSEHPVAKGHMCKICAKGPIKRVREEVLKDA